MKGLMMDFPLTTHAILEYANRVFPHKQIISKMPDGSRHHYYFKDLYSRTKRMARALTERLGVLPTERIATFAWNHYLHLELYYAIPEVGAICHTLNVRLSADQIAFIVNDADDKVIFVDASLVPLMEKVAEQTPGVRQYVLLNAPKNIKTTLPSFVHYEDLLEAMSEAVGWAEVDENMACAICYTSGTTGNPKAVVYSHRSTYLHALTSLMPNALGMSSKDRMLVIVPLFHAMSWGAAFSGLLTGADLVFASTNMQPASLIEILENEKITVAIGVPTIWLGVYDALMKNKPKQKLALREFGCGGSALPKSLIEGFEKNFGIQGVHAWGMTETSPVATVSRLQEIHLDLPEEERYQIRAKQGVELPGVEIKLVTEEGEDVKRDGKTMGEIFIRGAWVASAYYKSADKGQQFTADGWFKTGDVATIDAQGYIQITDRTKDLIKSGGEWISSVALENALMAHPGIQEACVIAIPHEKWVERPLACILTRPGQLPSEVELRDFLSKEFSPYQLPDDFVFVQEIPKTSVGKFNKKELRRMYGEGLLKNKTIDL